MTIVKILIEGYARPGPNDSYIACPSVVLVITNGKKILVDPGTNEKELLDSLKKQKLVPDDIDMIFLSHYHPDHFINIRLFPNTDIYDQETRWHQDEEYFYKDKIPDTDIQILPTPGHSPEHASLLVKTDEGMVCIAQDVFWWEDGKQKSDNKADLLNLEDPFVNDKNALLKSRQLVLEKADWIIPGHGKKFKVPR